MIQRFWRPFLGGIFFDNELLVTDRLLTFVMRSLATGQNCLPSAGIGAVAKQLAAGVEAERVVLNTRVKALVAAVAAELGQWFGPQVASWRHLRTYVVPFAQPGQSPPTRLERPVRVDSGSGVTRLYVCGDHVEAATLDGALRSGRRAAEAVLEDMGAA